MEFRILGSLEAEADDRLLPLGGPSVRRLLAILLLDANRVVPLARLAEGLWDTDAPETAVKQARNAVGRLRRLLAASGAPDLIVTDSIGYRIRVAADALDAGLFEARVAHAERAAADGQLTAAAELLRSALALWRGPLLAGMAGRVIERAATAWNERRYVVSEMYYDQQLALGRHHEIVAELSGFTSDHPLREKPVGQFMIALYRCGRQADALALYDRTRRLLADEMGIDPGPELRQLHQQILKSDAALTAQSQIQAERSSATRHIPPVVPRQLPGAVRHFAGRREELEVLARLLDQVEDTVAAVVISAIDGMAGIGKTALALYWAHHVANRFPDGQLYVNLRGFDPSGSPVEPAEAVRGFLDALGVPSARVPVGLAEQAAMYRSLLAGRRVLVILDNAREVAQVRPLLPGSPACLVVVTSRSQLTGLVVTEGACPLNLDLLADVEARELLSCRLGSARIAAEPEATREMIELCGHLPLALSIVAARAASHPRLPLAAFAAELKGAHERLDMLDAGEPAASVRTVISWSYQQLSEQAARMFRLLGLPPGPDISVPAAASLAAVDEPQARRLLRGLACDCLITEHVPGRYAFHDLLRAYAVGKARECDPEPDRDAATGRILDHYLHTASHNAMLLQPAREPVALTSPHAGTRPEQPGDHRQAMAWYEAEHQVLLAAVTLAAETGADSHAWQLPWAMSEYLHRRGYPHEHVTVMGSGLAAATRLDDALGQARSLRGLGIACASTGNFDQARAHLECCLPLYQRLDDRMGEAWARWRAAADQPDSSGRKFGLVGLAAAGRRPYRRPGGDIHARRAPDRIRAPDIRQFDMDHEPDCPGELGGVRLDPDRRIPQQRPGGGMQSGRTSGGVRARRRLRDVPQLAVRSERQLAGLGLLRQLHLDRLPVKLTG
jgi:DNA-binding SARP family transcriptional activator